LEEKLRNDKANYVKEAGKALSDSYSDVMDMRIKVNRDLARVQKMEDEYQQKLKQVNASIEFLAIGHRQINQILSNGYKVNESNIKTLLGAEIAKCTANMKAQAEASVKARMHDIAEREANLNAKQDEINFQAKVFKEVIKDDLTAEMFDKVGSEMQEMLDEAYQKGLRDGAQQSDGQDDEDDGEHQEEELAVNNNGAEETPDLIDL
jgi:hypothetical protein